MRERPNRDKLNRAVDVFRDAMRPFIVRKMRCVFGDEVEGAIRKSLGGRRSDEFMWSLQRGRSIEDSIDVNDFPHIVQENWGEVFRSAFKGDAAMKSTLGQIANARNRAVHPGADDLDSEYVRSRLYDVGDVLGRIGALGEKREVERIRDGLEPIPIYPHSPDEPYYPPRPRVGTEGVCPEGAICRKPYGKLCYWVYEDRVTSQVRVHEGKCRYCNHGDGMGHGRIPGDSEWHGPYASREEAFRRADATGRREVRGCGICRP